MPRRVVPNILGDSEVDSELNSDEFQSPEEEFGQTDYQLSYSSSRINNPFAPSTSRNAQTNAVARKVQPTARKRTGGSNSVQTRSASLVQATPAHRRKKNKPLHRSKKLLEEIQYLIRTTHLLIPRLPFSRLVREILMKCGRGDVLRITLTALEALHESTELYITQQLQDAYTLTLHRGRVTLHPKDMEVLRFLRGR